MKERPGALRLDVHVQPRASRDAIVGLHDGAVKIALRAPPVEGQANEALVRFLAKALGMKARDVRIVAGESTRRKVVELVGADAASVRARLASHGL